MMPKTAADVRAFIQNRAVDRPKAEAPAVVIDGRLADCCSGRGVDIDALRAQGLGVA